MLSETLAKELGHYSIGAKIRTLRLRKKMGLVELGQHSGLSPALLSKIERGRLVPTLPTLMRIALVFSVGLEHFFTETRKTPVAAVVRRADRKRFPETMDAKEPGYHFECLDYPAVERRMNAYYVQFEVLPPERARRHQHSGAEFLYLIEGKLTVSVGEDVYELGAGDSMYFDPTVPHSYARASKRSCAAIVVTTE